MLEKGRILPGKILIKEVKEKEKTTSGIIIAPTVKPKTYVGEVVLVGEDTPAIKMVVKEGNKVLHSPHAFAAVDIEGTEYRLLNQSDVLFIWE